MCVRAIVRFIIFSLIVFKYNYGKYEKKTIQHIFVITSLLYLLAN